MSMMKFVSLGLFFCLTGCAAIPAVVSSLNLAATVLPIIDSFYDTVWDAKNSSSKLQAATLILQQADPLVVKIKSPTKGTAADQEQLQAQAKILQAQAQQL